MEKERSELDLKGAEEWLDELFSLAVDESKKERYYGALSLAETLGISWKRSKEGVHSLELSSSVYTEDV